LIEKAYENYTFPIKNMDTILYLFILKNV